MEQLAEVSIFEDETKLHDASSGQRLANYLIDIITFYAAIFALFFVLGAAAPEVAESVLSFIEKPFVPLLLYGLYMGTVEAVFQGRSIGKLITGTKAVTEDGVAVSAGKAFLRGLIRAVPFNGLSGFGYHCNPWHDRWTNTQVIDIKKSVLPV
ncbi:RDD family protein [Chitinophaga sp.]|uniref:RDD family protein n=1 Tax=Chitinophaga sp. TaxID=1869181 RepID=UPI002F95C064